MELTGAYAPFSNGGFAVHALSSSSASARPNGNVLFEPHRLRARARGEPVESVAHDERHAAGDGRDGHRHAGPRSPAGRPAARPAPARISATPGSSATRRTSPPASGSATIPTRRPSTLRAATLPAMIWSKFMTRAHAGVPVAQLPGGELVPFLLAQPAPGAEGGWGASPPPSRRPGGERERMRDWILSGRRWRAIAGRQRAASAAASSAGSSDGVVSRPFTRPRPTGRERQRHAACSARPRAFVVRVEPLDQRPELRGRGSSPPVRDLVRGEVVEHVRRGEHQAPGEDQHALRRSRSPSGSWRRRCGWPSALPSIPA